MKIKKKFLKLSIVISLLCLLIPIVISCKSKGQQPNIIFILADDLGYSQIGCYGSDYYQTPHLDNLAKGGMRFTDAYAACPVCSPTRASIMTGKYPARLHLTDFIPGNKRDVYPLSQPDWQKFLSLEEVTVAELLKEQGYRTAIFGKWHLSPQYFPPESLPYEPDKQGFDEKFITHKPVPRDIAEPAPWQNAENDAHNVDTITSLALNFIERNQKNPFFLFVSHNTIHNPLKEKSASISRFRKMPGAENPENNPVIGAMIERLDNSCGRIFDKVTELGLDKNTVVIFFSDNGGLETDAAQTPLKKGKAWLYEGGIREPLIVKWKDRIKPNSVSHAMVSSVDFLPTFLELAGNSDNLPKNIDGASMVSILKDDEIRTHEILYWHYPHYHSVGMTPAGAVRSGNWKLIEWYEKSLTGNMKQAFELYNLEDDLGETTNVADIYKEKTQELAKKLEKWRQNVNAQMPSLNENYGKNKE